MEHPSTPTTAKNVICYDTPTMSPPPSLLPLRGRERESSLSSLSSSSSSSSSPSTTTTTTTSPAASFLASFPYCQEIIAMPSNPAKTTTTTTTSTFTNQKDEGLTSWKQRLIRVSNIASMLCVVDCTVLPAMTIILSVVGTLADTTNHNNDSHDAHQHQHHHHHHHNDYMDWLQSLGHSMAIYFVLPVGCFTAIMNYMTHQQHHQQRWYSPIPAMMGLLMIYIANCCMPHCHHDHDHHGSSHTRMDVTASFLQEDGHDHHHDDCTITSTRTMMNDEEFDQYRYHDHHEDNHDAGDNSVSSMNMIILHRFVNVMGCVLLLTSNYFSSQQSQDGSGGGGGGCRLENCYHFIRRRTTQIDRRRSQTEI